MNPDTLKLLRKHFNLSQDDIGRLVYRTQNTIAQWESGRRPIDKALWELILFKLGITEAQLDIWQKEVPNLVTVCQEEQAEFSFPKEPPKVSQLMPISQFRKNLEALMVSTHKAEQAKCKKSDLKFIDLFAGVGGIRSAFESAGAKCVFSSEIDVFAQYTYYANYGTVPYGDITKIDEADIPEHDILCAGFPCQPFSHIGKRQGFSHPTQGTMFYEIVRILKKRKPRAVFLENVPGLTNHDGGRTLDIILKSLEEIGYHCQYTILNAKDFGVPQSRARFYLVGFLDDIQFHFPNPPMKTADIGDFLEANVRGYEVSKHLQDVYLFKKDDGRPVLVDKNSKGPMKTLVSSYHKIQRLTGTFVKDGPTGIRLLTENECKAAMGFPKEFKIPVSRTQMYRQMGNSVVVKVINEIAKNVTTAMKG